MSWGSKNSTTTKSKSRFGIWRRSIRKHSTDCPSTFKMSEKLLEIREPNARGDSDLTPSPIPKEVNADLRPYQSEGVHLAGASAPDVFERDSRRRYGPWQNAAGDRRDHAEPQSRTKELAPSSSAPHRFSTTGKKSSINSIRNCKRYRRRRHPEPEEKTACRRWAITM